MFVWENVKTRIKFSKQIINKNKKGDLFLWKIVYLAIIIREEIHKVRIINGALKKSE